MYNFCVQLWNIYAKKFFLQYYQYYHHSNQLLLISGFSIIIFYISIKVLFCKRTVNCWFCNSNSVVKFSERNDWTCSKCSQYNGFDKTGNYNKVISEMYDVGKNSPSNCLTKTENVEEFPKLIDNSFKLCSTCNRNQLLKSRQIAKFEPISELCFDQEFNEFKSKLDDLYGLCRKCEKGVKRQIKTQDTMIRGQLKSSTYSKPYKLEYLFKEDSSNNSKCLFVANVCTLILASISFLSMFPEITKQITKVDSDVFKLINSVVLMINFFITFGNCIYSSMKKNSVCKLLLVITLSFVLLITDQLLFSIPFINEHVYIQKLLITQNIELMSYIVPFFYVKFVSFSVLYALLLFSPTNTKQNMTTKPNTIIPESMNSFNESKLNLTETQYSDVSSNSSKENAPNTPMLDGSLNALNISGVNVAKPAFCKKSQVSNVFFTPPPSRSSSFQSVNNGPQSAILPQRSVVSQKTNFNPINNIVSQGSIAPSTFGLNVNGLSLNSMVNKSSTFSNRYPKSFAGRSLLSNNQPSGSMFKQSPLIKPAKFSMLNSNGPFKSKKSCHLSNSLIKSPSKVSWVENNDFEVGVGDSVSQVGLRKRSRNHHNMYSDNEEEVNLITPRKNRNLVSNSSAVTSRSPRTVISAITNITSRGIEKVENSRFCKWLLAFLVLFNFVLLINIYFDMQEKRKFENRSNGWN